MKYSMEGIFFSIPEKMDRKEKSTSVEEDTWRMRERDIVYSDSCSDSGPKPFMFNKPQLYYWAAVDTGHYLIYWCLIFRFYKVKIIIRMISISGSLQRLKESVHITCIEEYLAWRKYLENANYYCFARYKIVSVRQVRCLRINPTCAI